MIIRTGFFFIAQCTLVGFWLFGMNAYVYAAQKPSEEALAEKLQEISKQAELLQKQMTALKAELDQLKQEKKAEERKIVVQAETQKKQMASVKAGTPQKKPMLKKLSLPVTVTTSPYIGLRSAFDASDLLINIPTMNEDLRLLRQRAVLKQKLGEQLPYLDRPIIVLSGRLEAFAYNRSEYEGGTENDIDLNTMELDLLVHASSWALGFISIDYDNSFFDTSLATPLIGSRVANSRLFLKRGFITLGDIDRFPFYLSVGQMYLDFGSYGSSLVTPPLTLLLGQANERQVQVGYGQADGFNFSAYAFRGETHTGTKTNRINEGGLNFSYNKELTKDFSLGFGAGLLTNIADADALQITNLEYPRQGFSSVSQVINLPNEQIDHRAPAMNLHAEFAFGSWTFISEYVRTLRAFSPRNFNYNGRGAAPKAFHSEINRKFLVFNKPANASLAYGQSWQALGMGLPRNKYAAVFNISFFKNTIVSIEFSRFRNYRFGTTAFLKGSDLELVVPPGPFVSPGGYSNMILAQLGLYF